MEKEKIKEALEKGYIQIHAMFEVVGNPKEHVEQSLKKYISEIKKDPQILMIQEEYAEPKEKEGLWNTFCECEMLILGLEKLSWLCINYTPASIDVVEPQKLTYRNKDITAWSNDLLSKLHEIGIVAKSVNQKNKTLEKNLSLVVRNCMIALLQTPMTSSQLSKAIGIPTENIQQFLNALEQENKVAKKGSKYQKVIKDGKE